MPWSGPDFQQHHNHHLGIAQAAHAASVANAILKHTGDEGLAIRTANAKEKRRDEGGAVSNEPPDLRERYNTPLSPDEEANYRSWATQNGRGNDTYDYDLRGAWKSGAATSENGHLPDTFKKPNHPTFSDQSQYHGIDGNQGGAWTQLEGGRWRFVPSPTNLRMMGPENLKRYFQEREQGNELAMPDRSMGGIVPRRDDGGGIADPTQGAPGSFTPSPQTINPVTQGMIQHYAGLPVEKLQELAGMLGNSPQGQIVQKLLAQKRTSPQPVQATAAPQSLVSPVAVPGMGARNGGHVAHREVGGGVSASQAAPWWTRSQASADARPSGFLAGPTAGRADAVHTSAPGGSYILPADIISGLGEGNSLAGAKIWDTILRTGPWGTTPVRAHGGHGWPSPPHGAAQAKGGGVGESHGHPTPVALSHGETIVFPDDVVKIGGGNLKRGHRILDAFVLHERKKQVAKISSLPGPVGAKKA